MPRPRKNTSSSPLSHGQASYVLDRLIRERRISSGDVSRYMDEMRREISDLEERLNRLRAAHGGPVSSGTGSGAASTGTGAGAAAPARRGRRPGRPGRPAGTGRGPGRPRKAASAPANAGANAGGAAAAGAGAKAGGAGRGRKQRSAITPEQLASRQLQGRYLALVRQFPENKRAQYAKTAKDKGRESAIKEMQEALKK